ncbi:MAG: hypothetical protein KC419_21845 [Anaerolineales bacterium]|nr:hypothetical protein [Anaerolineales bacterium]MCA9931150.1 hypothetical protein [Anaerolineales bacterium]
MRLEKKKEQEIARRQGMTGKTIIQIIWLVISAGVAYFLLTYMIESEEINFTYGTIYRALFIPTSVPRWVVLSGLIIIFVLFMQMFLALGFAIASPEGRRKTGKPTLYSRNKDPFDDRY